MRASQMPTVRQPATEGSRRTRGGAQPLLVLDRYRLHRRLGTGGFGTVWLARDERLDRDVAVKILPRERVIGGRFEREARAAARLQHPGIVTLYEAAVDDDGAYLVSELVRGATLDDLVQAGRLSDRDVLAIAVALCDALAHAHGHGIVHRDVKPSNVLVPERPVLPGQVAKLTDFGVARVLGGSSLTRTGDVIGTAAYMSPEQAEGLEAGATADLYSLAVVVYEALTGLNPVRTGTAAGRARRLGAHLPPLRRQRRDLPRELGQGIDLALRPRPRERGSIEELRKALAAGIGQVQDSPGVVSSAWRARTDPVDSWRADADPAPSWGPRADPAASWRADADVPSEQEHADPAPRPVIGWSARALAALTTALLAGWLVSHLLAPAPVSPAVGALIGAVLAAAAPRVCWIVLAIGLTAALALQHRAGGALVVLAMAVVPVAGLPRDGAMWPLSAAAPALGALGLGGAWPALAARASSAWRRAVLGMTGWIWLVVAGPLAGRDLYLRRPPGIPSPEVWTASLHQTVHQVLGGLLSTGELAPAPVWAAAAVVLPWLMRSRSAAVVTVLVTVWAATLVSATTAAVGLIHGAHGGSAAPSAVLGAVACAIVALAPTAAKSWRSRRMSAAAADSSPGLA